jgi:hypothetical protein
VVITTGSSREVLHGGFFTGGSPREVHRGRFRCESQDTI